MPTEQFIGEKKVGGISDFGPFPMTDSGAKIISVFYEDGKSETMTKNVFDILVTDSAIDATGLRERKLNFIVKKILQLLIDCDFRTTEYNFLRMMIESGINNSMGRSINYLWTKDDSLFIPGGNCEYHKSLLDADLILKSIPKKDESTEEPKIENVPEGDTSIAAQ